MAYATWAKNNNSLLIVEWDEDQSTTANPIATMFVGPPVKPENTVKPSITTTSCATIEDLYGLT